MHCLLNQSRCTTNCFRKLEPSKAEYDSAVNEGAYAYHSVLHNHSFLSMDSTKSLQKKFADKKFSCARSKYKSIVTNVYVPSALEELKNDPNVGTLLRCLAILLIIST
jgi:hypothetical protein